ncbi:hypothetical protein NPIL_265641 [Nephila pilipes]|uniref:CCHC-type domain-containing protein n=1 Tax=Nephila pilipes TaxID=299642 RepID=A0A8X6M8A0_NEPPI|nr:hypothetical protein NPIL_265641 [Nephila pilipes]
MEKNISGNHNSTFASLSCIQSQNVNNTICRPPVSCYGCGNPGFIKAKCPKCSLKKERASVNAKNVLPLQYLYSKCKFMKLLAQFVLTLEPASQLVES